MGEANINLPAELSAGEIVDCTVEQIMPYGAFMRIAKNGRKGMIHISELSYSFVKNITDVLNIGDKIKAKVIKIDERGRIDLSLKQTQEPPQRPARPDRRNAPSPAGTAGRPAFQAQRRDARPPRESRDMESAPREFRDFRAMQTNYRDANPEEGDSFEKKMASFLKTSEAKITDLNTRNSARSGRPSSRRKSNGRDY